MTKVETKIDKVRVELIVKKLADEMLPRINGGKSLDHLFGELKNTMVFGIMKAPYDAPILYLNLALESMKKQGKIVFEDGLYYVNGEYHG